MSPLPSPPPKSPDNPAQETQAPNAEPNIWDRLTVQPGDSRRTAALKIAAGIGIGIGLLVISPLILLGIVVGLFAVA